MSETVYFWLVVGLLLVSGLWHIAAPELTERWMSNARVVRTVGTLLLALAIPSRLWRGWYFWTLFAALTASGLWRLCFPQSSIRAQRQSYPRFGWMGVCSLEERPDVGATANRSLPHHPDIESARFAKYVIAYF